MNLSNATGNAMILDAQGTGLIVNNDGATAGTESNACRRNSATPNFEPDRGHHVR